MEIPIKIKVGAHEFLVRQVKLTNRNEEYGNMWLDQGLIEIDLDIMQSLKEETFFHEVGHAILEISGLNKDMTTEEEEKFIQSFMHSLYQFLIDNNLLK